MLTPTRCIGITTPGDMFSTVSEQIDANIAFLPSRILARSVSFRCQVSTHRRFLDLHFLGNAQIIPTTAPDAMLMSRCPTGPKSTYLLFPRPRNGTRCYVNEPVPELIYAKLDFTSVNLDVGTVVFQNKLKCKVFNAWTNASGESVELRKQMKKNPAIFSNSKDHTRHTSSPTVISFLIPCFLLELDLKNIVYSLCTSTQFLASWIVSYY